MTERDDIIAFWFPEDGMEELMPEQHGAYWHWRMQGGADDAIKARFVGTTERAIAGDLDHWADTPMGRLALVIVLDQFPRSIWRDDARAYAQDKRALDLVMGGYDNGHYDALPRVWHKTTYNLPLGHCEGEGHLERLDLAVRLAQAIHNEAPDPFKPGYAQVIERARMVREVIERFGRHPHRNAALGRKSTPQEAEYIERGQFPHLAQPGTGASRGR